MPSTQQVKQAGRRRGKLLLVTGVVLLMLLALAWWLDTSGSDNPASAPPRGVPGTPDGPSPQGVTLPEAKQLQGERFPVGFPHTAEGAAGAMAAMLGSTWTMNADNNRSAAEVYASPEIRDVARQVAAPAAADLRQRVGLPAVGRIPTGAYVALTPMAVRWKAIGADHVQVAMMMTVSSSASAQAAPSSRVVTVGAGWVWDPRVRGGDWVFTGDNVDSLVPPIATPGTEQFSRLGWRAVIS